jgi:hypothetical protein
MSCNTAGRCYRARPRPLPTSALTSCTTATIFSDCFGGTPGLINTGSPGPVQGWTFSQPFGPKGGNITFTPGLMSFDTIAINNAPGAQKQFVPPLLSALNLTIQFKFTEYPLVTGAGRFYDHFIVTTGATAFVEIFLDDTGFAEVACGLNNSADGYTGTWTPVSGATHKVDVTVSALNVPVLFIDNVSIPIAFSGTGFGLVGGFPTNCVQVSSTAAGAAGPTSSKIENFFVTAGNLPNTTVYCCP